MVDFGLEKLKSKIKEVEGNKSFLLPLVVQDSLQLLTKDLP